MAGSDEVVARVTSGVDVFAADAEVGRDLAAVDWAGTPLGPPQGWPQSLRTAVNILLSSRFSMWMAWGPELTFFCNDAYRRDTLGQKYPWALGRPASEVWQEIWQDIGPRIDRVLEIGTATWDEGLLLFLERAGYPEETYHTFSYSPLRDEHGAVVGMLCVVTEDTERVIGERRMATLRDLGSDPSVIRTETQMLEFAGVQLGGNQRDLPFTLTYLFDEAGSPALAASSGVTGPVDAVAGSVEVWLDAAVRAGVTRLVQLDRGAGESLPTGEWPLPPVQAMVVPLRQQGETPLGFMVMALNRYRPLDEAYRAFVELAAGHVAAGVLSARSYQAQRSRADELAALDRAKTTFFSNVSHEFRTPLSLITGPVQQLRAWMSDPDAHPPASVREDVEVIHRNGLRLGKLVNTLLDFSRIEAGRMQARYEPVDLAAVTLELASSFRSAVDQAGLRFDVDCPALPQRVYVDRDMWEKVILNLLSNAVKFTFDGSISIRLTGHEDHVVLEVADTGTGIAETEMPRLFERFHRVEHARSRSTEGSGIGLALVKELVGLHGGSITAVSREHQGTTFTIQVPFGRAHLPAECVVEEPGQDDGGAPGTAESFVQEALRWQPTPELSRPASVDGPADTEHPVAAPLVSGPMAGRVLVADDNADMRGYLARLLRGTGHEVRIVSDGQAALEAIRADPPDVVVSDVMMPRLDGLELIAALRADPRVASVPVLLLSARAGQEASVQGLEAGADDYLVKPFAAADLLARVRANIGLARLRAQHARWRTALVDSLQEGFFLSDADGTLVEINAAFATILGYGPDGLPYPQPYPWWPDPKGDPHAYQLVVEEHARALERGTGEATVPATHRDGHRVWLRSTFSRVEDPVTGEHLVVGTIRDVTAEHYTTRRDAALATLAEHVASADTVSQALAATVIALQRIWSARHVAVASFAAPPTGSGDVGEPDVVRVSDRTEWAELAPAVRDAIRGMCTAPALTPQVELPGCVGISMTHLDGVVAVRIDLGPHRTISPEDQALLSVLAGRLSQSLHRLYELDQQRETALALQHAILGPDALPDGFAVRYQPASRPLQIGGDWYDTVPLSEGRIGVVVGDCVGHGLAAATVMGQLRSACRALLLEHGDPAQALAGLDRFAALLPGARCATVLCAVLDPATGHLVYSSAGHPPPILAHADGTTTTLEGGHGIPLGVRINRPRDLDSVTLPPRATLLLYTDGLVERRRRSLSEGISRAASAVHDAREIPVNALASHLMTSLAPDSGFEDDVAVLIYRQPGPLQVEFPAQASELPPVREAVRDWLTRCDVDPHQATNVLIATGEACANAVEHGHRHHVNGVIRLRATALAHAVRITVIDSGSWKTPDLRATAVGRRGRGIPLMRGLMHQVAIHPTENGTTVEMYARITA
ncbi:histidine kinase [Actinosynnema sp. ALI-1.44]|uniref:SpoIIE family protein phosphatase n=1 Tax=Actinosynnema sp. ALI-1.44 TaxID=1933779 RepID=UPI00097C3CC3|nr:SpoIIE family protein phosphatase [Actinosynnema sp. ALI-1.44]ONI87864.1 histidine kinase [Actinosynnema sp. ALI-1.44]